MCAYHGFRSHLLDFKEIIIRRDFTQRHNYNAVGLTVRRLKKQVLKIPEPLRVAQRLDIGAALWGISHVRDVHRLRPLTAGQRSEL